MGFFASNTIQAFTWTLGFGNTGSAAAMRLTAPGTGRCPLRRLVVILANMILKKCLNIWKIREPTFFQMTDS